MTAYRLPTLAEKIERELTLGLATVAHLELLVWVWTGLLVAALLAIIVSLLRQNARLAVVGLLLTTLAAATGVLRQLDTERQLLDARSSGKLITIGTSRAAQEQAYRELLGAKRALAQRRALTALPLLLLGAFAALRRKGPTHELAPGLVICFLLLGAGVTWAAYTIARRPLPVDRYDFAEDDRDSWSLASTIDQVLTSTSDPVLWCNVLSRQLEDRWGGAAHEWPRVMRHPVPPALSPAWREAAARCITASLDRMERLPTASALALQREVLGSPLLHDEGLRARALAWGPR